MIARRNDKYLALALGSLLPAEVAPARAAGRRTGARPRPEDKPLSPHTGRLAGDSRLRPRPDLRKRVDQSVGQ
jgi:hypothetical protein